jgi:hypothetical protein
VEDLKDQWAEGRFNSENQAICTAANVSAVHQLKAFQEIIDIDVDEINQELEGGSKESLGVAPNWVSGAPKGN